MAVVLAAGESTRMKSDIPKVLHEVCGRPMLAYVLNACRLAGAERLYVVVGHLKEAVMERFRCDHDLEWVEQPAQRGTADAVKCCREALQGFVGSVLVIAGDMPLVRRETLAGLIEVREQSGDALSMATTVLDDPTGYGRIIRDGKDALLGIVEHRDCTAEQRDIHEVNPSYYCFDAVRLFDALDKVEPQGPKDEFYLTETVKVFRDAGHGVSAEISAAPEDAMGINSRLDLAVVGRIMQDRIQFRLMSEGVTIVDPDNTWIEDDVTAGRDTIIYPFSVIRAGACIGARCRIGPFAQLRADQRIEDGKDFGPGQGDGAAS